MADTVKVQVRYTVETEVGTFSDALYYALDEWPNVTTEQMEAEKQRRASAWVTAIKSPAPDPEDAPNG